MANKGNPLVGQSGDELGFVRLVKTLGEPGEQGEVWLGDSKESEFLKFAIKISHKPIGADDNAAFRAFDNEFQALAVLRHRSIVKVYDRGVYEKDGAGYPYYIMEYLGEDACPLHQAVDRAVDSQRLSILLSALAETASALRHAHDESLSHRDIKPSNILVYNIDDVRPSVKLIDFGFARVLPPDPSPSSSPRGVRSGALKVSSYAFPTEPKSFRHLDVWQLAYTFHDLFQTYLEDLSTDRTGALRITFDYEGEMPRLRAFLKTWSESDVKSRVRNEEDVTTFYDQLDEILLGAQLSELPGSTRAGLRYLGIDEIAMSARVLRAFEAVRIPPRQLVLYPVRVKRVITTSQFGALRYMRQLGFTCLVYPGAQGTRFEHSLGVYDLACQLIVRLSTHPLFRRICPKPIDAHKFVIAALLHDVGHYPLAHQIEEFSESDFTKKDWGNVRPLVLGHIQHGKDVIDSIFKTRITGSSGGALTQFPLAELFHFTRDDIEDVRAIMSTSATELESEEGKRLRPTIRFLVRLLDGAIDIDKLDYVERDAHHCGVPYGHYLDIERIFDTLTLVERPDVANVPILAFERRGVGSLEQLATARHQMYANVYWHRAVRSATVMFRHAFYIFQHFIGSQRRLTSLFFDAGSDDRLLASMEAECETIKVRTPQQKCAHTALGRLLSAVSGRHRELYKPVVDLEGGDNERASVGGFNYPSQRKCASRIYDHLYKNGMLTSDADEIAEHNVLIDCRTDNLADFASIPIVDDTGKAEEDLGTIVPSIRHLNDDFHKQACRVRIFVNRDVLHPGFRAKSDRPKVGSEITDFITNKERSP